MVEASEPHTAAELALPVCLRCNRSGTSAKCCGVGSRFILPDGVRTRPTNPGTHSQLIAWSV
jgi:hypothetical protein